MGVSLFHDKDTKRKSFLQNAGKSRSTDNMNDKTMIIKCIRAYFSVHFVIIQSDLSFKCKVSLIVSSAHLTST